MTAPQPLIDLLLEALAASRRGLTEREISRRLGCSPQPLKAAIRQLERDGTVRRRGGRLRLEDAQTTAPTVGDIGNLVQPPQGLDILRRLCALHADIIYEIGANDLKFELGDQQLEAQLTRPIRWYELGQGPLPVDRRVLPQGIGQKPKERTTFCGPLHVVRRYVRGTTQRLAYPIFMIHASSRRQAGHIEFTMQGDVEVNLAWLDAVFDQSSEDLRDDVLIRLGFMRENEDFEQRSVRVRNLADSWEALRDRVPEFAWVEERDLISPPRPYDFSRHISDGIHPCILAIPEKLPGFTKGLINDLRAIAAAEDEDLRSSALPLLLPPESAVRPQPSDQDSPLVLAEASPLNPRQRSTVTDALHQPLTVVQGPPGTGKSTVVCSTLVSIGVNDQAALFSSMNHKAVDAVMDKLRKKPGQPCQAEEDTAIVADLRPQRGPRWAEHLMRRLDAAEQVEQIDLAELQVRLGELDKSIEHELTDRARELQDSNELVEAAETIKELAARHPSWAIWIQGFAPAVTSETLLDQIESVRSSSGWRRLISRFALWRSLARARASWPESESPTVEDCLDAATWAEQAAATDAIERRLRRSRSREERHLFLSEAQAEKAALVETALPSLPSHWAHRVSGHGAVLHKINSARRQRGRHAETRAAKLERDHFKELLPGLPLWAITSLSVNRAVPLRAGAFDLAVIDEAGQCHPSAVLPILFRAQRALFVGDPKQLRPVVSLSAPKQDHLRSRYGMTEEKFDDLMFSGRSAYDLAEAALAQHGGQPTLLREHYRCHPAIAKFFNEHFYDNQLIVRTTETARQFTRTGISWTDVEGGSTTLGSSRYHPPQIEAIVSELRRLADERFAGTVGVVTPFREHAKRIRDAAHRELSTRQISDWQFIADTADGFQGGERDVILFGLVGGGSTEPTTPRFYMSEHNRFNVAVSRARLLLHVFGDLSWARACPVPVLNGLCQAFEESLEKPRQGIRADLIGPVWEPRLAQELRRAGVPFEQQYPTCGVYLDFAMLRPSGQKLNVEVDGETYHRDKNGNLREEDVWRDQMLVANGWRVKRFWVYELREDMAACVQQIKDLLRESSL